MRAAEQFAKRHVPVESHAQMASAAESSMSRTRRSLSLRTSFACNHTGLIPEGGMLHSGRGEGRDTGWRGIHSAVNMLPADTSLYTRSSLLTLVAAEDRHTGYEVCPVFPPPSAEHSEKTVWHVVKKTAASMNLPRLAPHDLRMSCARLCYDSGGELEQIQFLLGHVSVQTIERYLGCKQRIRSAVNDHIGIEPNP